MRQHIVELDKSFVENFSSLDPQIQEEITAVWRDLENDPYFLPQTDDYAVRIKKRINDRIVACQHITGWDGWQLNWYFEYFDIEPDTPERVILMLRNLPSKPIAPIRRS
jgi:hypothetical protein